MSWDPSLYNEWEPFSACDKIASFYEKQQVPYEKSVGTLGGKRYTWHVRDEEQSYILGCACTFGTLGYGELSKTKDGRLLSGIYKFTKSSDVNPDTAKVVLERPFKFSTYEMQLPKTKKSNWDDDNFGV